MNSEIPQEVFFDDFDGDSVNTDRWRICRQNWGGFDAECENKIAYNGGVVPENVCVRDGKLVLTANGNLYRGETKGVYPSGFERPDNIRVGGMISSKQRFASGKYEVSMRISPEIGVCSCAFTFEYEKNKETGYERNHEIDFEFPGRKSMDSLDNISYDYVLITSWVGLLRGEHETRNVNWGKTFADGCFHTYTFDWHTGDEKRGIAKSIDFYVDGELLGAFRNPDVIPFHAGEMDLGLWFPNQWTGSPDFETTTMEVDWIRITPYHEANDIFPEGE